MTTGKMIVALAIIGSSAIALAAGAEMGSLPLAGEPIPVSIDLSNLSLPAALVIVAWLFRSGFPLSVTLHMMHHHNDPAGDESTSGIYRWVPIARNTQRSKHDQ